MIRHKHIVDNADRIFFIGDIHGKITALNEKLNEIGFNKELDHLYSVGDLIDRGENSLACLELIDEPWFTAVRGNHEQMMIDAISNPKDGERELHWLQNGGSWFYQMDKDSINVTADYVKNRVTELPHVIELYHKDKVIVICHADWPFNEYNSEIKAPVDHLIWSRERIENRSEQGEIKGADMFVFGHTPLRNPTKRYNQFYLDTGAVFGKEMHILSFEELFK